MTRSVQWSDPALADYFNQLEYIARENPLAADHVGDRIYETARDLGTMSTGRPGRIAGTLEKVVTGLPYIIAYEIGWQASDAECIIILRIIHGARDWRPGRWPD